MQYLGIISALLVVMACSIPVIGRRDKGLTISRHAATHRTYWLYVSLSSVGLVLFYYFMLSTFIPSFGLSGLFGAILTIGLFCDLISLYIPDIGGLKSKAHGFLAYIMMLSIPVMILYVVITTRFHSAARLISLFVLTVMIAIMIGMRVSKHIRRNILFYQSFYIVSYFFVILSAYYIS